MSLARLKTLYCIAVMAVGTLLAFFGGVVGWLAAVIILSSALPAWRAVISIAGDTGAHEALTVFQHQLQDRRSTRDDEAAPASQDQQAIRR